MERAFSDGEHREKRDVREVRIPASRVSLSGTLTVPAGAVGIVVFAHGSGSGRQSPRNRFVADQLQERGVGTLLLDLLTIEEEALDLRTAQLRFDIQLLASRLLAAVQWTAQQPGKDALPLGLFGASTGAAAALMVAAQEQDRIQAVVSRGGRPDLAGDALRRVLAPTLLIVGERDEEVLELNRRSLLELRAPHQLQVVPGASHLFEEPGALERVAALAAEFLRTHLPWDH